MPLIGRRFKMGVCLKAGGLRLQFYDIRQRCSRSVVLSFDFERFFCDFILGMSNISFRRLQVCLFSFEPLSARPVI